MIHPREIREKPIGRTHKNKGKQTGNESGGVSQCLTMFSINPIISHMKVTIFDTD